MTYLDELEPQVEVVKTEVQASKSEPVAEGLVLDLESLAKEIEIEKVEPENQEVTKSEHLAPEVLHDQKLIMTRASKTEADLCL